MSHESTHPIDGQMVQLDLLLRSGVEIRAESARISTFLPGKISTKSTALLPWLAALPLALVVAWPARTLRSLTEKQQ